MLARLAPSRGLASLGDELLAALVGLTAVQIDPAALVRLRGRAPAIVGLALAALLADTAIAYAVSRAFHGALREGVLSLGLASTEVASVGLIGLAGAETASALGVLTASLVASAILGPPLAHLLANAGGGGSLAVVGRFALIVLAPLAGGLIVRGRLPAVQRVARKADGLAALVVCLLLYATVSGVHGGHQVLAELAGGAMFLAAAGALGVVLAHVAGRRLRLDPPVILFTTGLRDFAVAATIARVSFGADAAGVAGVYGALMLLTGTLGATVLRRRAARD